MLRRSNNKLAQLQPGSPRKFSMEFVPKTSVTIYAMHLKVALSFSLLAALFLTGCNSNTVIESTPEEIDPQHVANEWMTAHYAEVQQWGAQVPMSDSVAIGMVEAFYANHEYNTVWTTAGEPNQQAVEVTNLMAQAVNYGLDSSYYDLAALRALYQEVNTLEAEAGMEAMARYEWKLTHESLVFMSHLNQGVLETRFAMV